MSEGDYETGYMDGQADVMRAHICTPHDTAELAQVKVQLREALADARIAQVFYKLAVAERNLWQHRYEKLREKAIAVVATWEEFK